jgi:tetratricopeptide (TPR) repeat protein
MTMEAQEMANKIRRRTLVLVAIVLHVPVAHAYQFMPTDIEWQTWPGYCKAKYTWTNFGKKTKFANLVTPAQKSELAQWEAEGIRGVHHHCTGSIWLSRARLERSPQQKRSMLDNAMGESRFSYNRSNVQSPKFAYMAIQIASIYYERGEYDPALQVLLGALADNPGNDVLYSATAMMQRKLGDTKEAKDTLLLGFEAMDGKSAEICYNLGLLSLELGEIDDAEKYAKLAYEQDYPLPWLRKKLEELGRM